MRMQHKDNLQITNIAKYAEWRVETEDVERDKTY